MARLHVEAHGRTTAGAESLWAVLADAEGYSSWGPWDESRWESRGDASADGVGAVRVLRTGRTTLVERIDEVQRPRRMAYTVLGGIPVRGYRSEVVLTPDGDGTEVRWSADWDRTLRSRLVHRPLARAYPRIVAALIAAAEAGVAP